jgi:hypothetical protein
MGTRTKQSPKNMARFDYVNRCTVCGIFLGGCNPRQLCEKTWCSGECMKCGSFDCGGLCDLPEPSASPEPSPKRARIAEADSQPSETIGGHEDVWQSFGHLLLARSRA